MYFFGLVLGISFFTPFHDNPFPWNLIRFLYYLTLFKCLIKIVLRSFFARYCLIWIFLIKTIRRNLCQSCFLFALVSTLTARSTCLWATQNSLICCVLFKWFFKKIVISTRFCNYLFTILLRKNIRYLRIFWLFILNNLFLSLIPSRIRWTAL